MIRSMAAGLLLSTALQACAQRAVETPPTVVAVETRDRPPAELLACPERPEGFPTEATAVMPRPVRDAAMRLAQSYAEVASQLERLIAWHAPETCKENFDE